MTNHKTWMHWARSPTNWVKVFTEQWSGFKIRTLRYEDTPRDLRELCSCLPHPDLSYSTYLFKKLSKATWEVQSSHQVRNFNKHNEIMFVVTFDASYLTFPELGTRNINMYLPDRSSCWFVNGQLLIKFNVGTQAYFFNG